MDAASLSIETVSTATLVTSIVEDPVVAGGWVPGAYLPGWEYASGTAEITIPLTALSDYGLQASDCDPDVGDARAVIAALARRAAFWLESLDNQPSALTAGYKLSYEQYSDFAGNAKHTITINAYTNALTGQVSDEPT
jgi:hypothetical protein